MHNEDAVKTIVDAQKSKASGYADMRKRFRRYLSYAHHILKNYNVGYKIRLGYCILKFVRVAFPENDPQAYTGFKYGRGICQYSENSSDSS